MQKKLDQIKDHYIVCGVGRVGSNIAHELSMTGRPFVLIDSSMQNISTYLDKHPEQFYLHGDATDNDMLLAAGVTRAKGLFAVAPDDTLNLVISLSARQLNAKLRIVARCHDLKNAEKTRRAGADEIVSPDFTGGLRLVSAMLRPHVVTFLDEMLRTDNNLRIEEISVSANFAGKKLELLQPKNREYILLATRAAQGKWLFNPELQHVMHSEEVLMVMTTPEGRAQLESVLHA